MDAKNAIHLKPVSKDLLYIKVADAIHAHIQANGLRPGDKLPSEREMAEAFGTSRNSVREALRVLENQGLLVVKTGRGTFLRERSGEGDAVFTGLVKNSFRDAHELCSILEAASVRKAARFGSETQKRDLLSTAEKMSALLAEERFSDELDHDFHAKVAEMAGNGAISHVIRTFRSEVYGQYWHYLDYDKNGALETVPNHLDLARAIAEGDADRAASEQDAISRHTERIMAEANRPGPSSESGRIRGMRKQ